MTYPTSLGTSDADKITLLGQDLPYPDIST